jgi:uncharacterized protein
MRRIAGALGVLLLWAAAAPAADFAALQPEGYISDFARVIDPATRAAMERYCSRVEAQTGAQIAVVTLDTLSGEPLEDVANAIFRKWGVGKKGTNEGVLLLLVTNDRRMRLEVGYGLEPIIPDGFAGSILRTMRPALKESRYGEAVREALQVLGSRIAESKGTRIDAELPQPVRRSAPSSSFPAPLMIFGVFLLFWVLTAVGGGRGRRTRLGGSGTDLLLGMLLGNILGRSMGSGRGSGGFGGFDSGGGFGGFGGGDSGGGGASSGW